MVDIKPKPILQNAVAQSAQSAQLGQGVAIDLGKATSLHHVPEISAADLQACLKRSGAARSAHKNIERHLGDGTKICRRDLEGMLARAGVETTDVKTVLAWHAKHSTKAFSDDAIHFLGAMDWSDVAAAHIDGLRKQNQDQVEGHRAFIDQDRREFEKERKADGQKLQQVNAEKSRLQQKTPLEMEADFAEETTKSGLNSKESFLLLAHRKRFVNKD